MRSSQRAAAALAGAALLLFAAGCAGKKTPAAAPPPPFRPENSTAATAAEAPAIPLFSAEPSTIQPGESALLRWRVERASGVSLEPGIGAVSAEGSRNVSPSASTTYRLHVSGPGGVADATATVAVTAPPPPPPPPPSAAPVPVKTLTERISADVGDVYFDYDQYDVREDSSAALTRDADALKEIFHDFPEATIVIEGHCDERGSAEYNLGLGDRRASAVRDYLVRLGVPASRLSTISYGKERPQCTEAAESCWQRNRRAHFSTRMQASPGPF
jgi:peptidoglycan-associated lipoprotein